MTSIDEVICQECGYRCFETKARSTCPECDAPLNNYYKQKIFGHNTQTRGRHSQ